MASRKLWELCHLSVPFGRLRHSGFTCRSLVVPSNVGEPKRTNREVIKVLAEAVIGGPHTYDPEGYRRQREKLQESMLPKSQEEMIPRKMSDSFDHSLIPLGKDVKLREKYLTHLGVVRVGRLLEDMDMFAVHLVFKHILLKSQTVGDEESQSPFSIVTALVDRISMERFISTDEDLKLSGHVTWVGRSSAESTLNVHQLRKDSNEWERVIEARFVLVARDSLNEKAALINPLVTESPEEKGLHAMGQKHCMERRGKAVDSLLKNPPSVEENEIIHNLFIETLDHRARSFKARIKPESSTWMDEAKLKTVVICQPENRNRFNKIFGGFIMRQAFELGWACAYVFAGKRRPRIKFMDDIMFERPVEIGSLLYFNAQVAYTHLNYVQVRVGAEALDPNTGELNTTNTFHYTFELKDGEAPRVIPKTYHEAMMYLNSRRHFLACTR